MHSFFSLKTHLLLVTFPTAPHTEVTAKGDIVYSEVVRENVRKLEAYVEEMASGDGAAGPINTQKVQDDVLKLWTVVKSLPEINQDQKNRIKALYEDVVRSLHKGPDPRARVQPRSRRSSSQFLRPQNAGATPVSAGQIPLLHLKRKVGTTWEYSSNLTGVYLDILHEIATSGTTFEGKMPCALVSARARLELRSSKDFSLVVLTSLSLLPATTVRLSNIIRPSSNLSVVVDLL